MSEMTLKDNDDHRLEINLKFNATNLMWREFNIILMAASNFKRRTFSKLILLHDDLCSIFD